MPMKKQLLALLATSLAPALGNADTGKCIPRIEQFKDVDQLIAYEGRCLEALAMGEDRTQECGGVATSIIRSANHSAHELQCSATLSALQFTFSNSFKATAAPEIDNICK